jgi:hypothetical protein
MPVKRISYRQDVRSFFPMSRMGMGPSIKVQTFSEPRDEAARLKFIQRLPGVVDHPPAAREAPAKAGLEAHAAETM